VADSINYFHKDPKRRRLLRASFGVIALSFLGGCSPEFDWREVRHAEGRFIVQFPARWHAEVRPLAGGGGNMQLLSARAADTLFAVGWADVPVALQAQRMDEWQRALSANIGADTGADTGATVGPNVGTAKPAGEPVLAGGGRMIMIDGRVGAIDVRLRLRLVPAGSRLYQVAVLGPRDAVPEAEWRGFFESFRVLAG
jgi:hypothetical protein